MSLPTVAKSEKVRLNYDEPISFRVEVGFGNPAGTEWYIGDQRGTIAGPEEVSLKGGADLEFLTLHIITTVEDVSDATDKTAVTYHLRNGSTTHSFPFTFTLEDKSRFVMYLIDINLF